MSSAKFSEFVMCVDDLYNVGLRNGYHLPAQKSSAVNELMLINVLKGNYWCPKTEEIRIKNCVKPPLKEVLLAKLWEACAKRGLNIAWIDPQHTPNKKWVIEVLATLEPADEIFRKDYVAPPVRKRLRDIETIVLPDALFADMPKSTSKVKARRLKVFGQVFEAEKANRLKEMQKQIYDEIITHEERLDQYKDMMKAQKMQANKIFGVQEEEKKRGDPQTRVSMTASAKPINSINNSNHSGGRTLSSMNAGHPQVRELKHP